MVRIMQLTHLQQLQTSRRSEVIYEILLSDQHSQFGKDPVNEMSMSPI